MQSLKSTQLVRTATRAEAHPQELQRSEFAVFVSPFTRSQGDMAQTEDIAGKHLDIGDQSEMVGKAAGRKAVEVPFELIHLVRLLIRVPSSFCLKFR